MSESNMTDRNEWRKRWVEALESGQYRQGYGALHTDDNRFCALGVLCAIHPDVEWKDKSNKPDSDPTPTPLFAADKNKEEVGALSYAYPPDTVIDAVFIDEDLVANIFVWNDEENADFSLIAKYLREEFDL